MIYDDGIVLNADKRVMKCPVCGNSELSEEDKHCKICGFMLYNVCLNENSCGNDCYHNNLGDSRYCILCGSETYFSREGVLNTWNDSRELNIKRMELELEITSSSPKSSALFEWDFILFNLEVHKLIAACLEKSTAKLISNSLFIYLHSKKQKEILLDTSLGYALFSNIEKICTDENLEISFDKILLIAPDDYAENIEILDGIPF